MNLQTWGTPDQCYDTIVRNVDRIGTEAYVGVFSYAGRPWAEAERNLTCFPREDMPRLQSRVNTGNIAWAA
jgi:hypothetical protein